MRSRHVRGVAMIIAAAMMLAGCSGVGPSADDIDPSSASAEATKNYVIVDLNQQVANILAQYRVAPFATRFAAPRPAPGQIVGVGDVLNITLFEAGQGGLFQSEFGARVTLTQRVDSDGSISVPYAGRIKAAGSGPQQVEKRIVAALEGRAIQPQALVQITETVSRSFVVSGDVGRPGRMPITAAGDRILDAIATSGGSRNEPFATRVTLQRGSSQGSVIMKDLIDNPADNVYVQPGDRIFLTKDPEIFLAFGAVTKVGPTEFGREKISLLEAVGMAGGLIDSRSDAGGFFVFRYEPSSAVKQMKPDYDGRFGDKVPVVYRMDLKDPQAYFYAKTFAVRDKDVLYVANAPMSDLQKFLQVIGSVSSMASTAYTVDRISNMK